MSKEQDRLLIMLKENKIKEEDYQMLSAALRKKSFWENSVFLNLLNPFQKIAGLKALMLGLFIILAVSYFGFLAKIYFVGLLGYLPASLVKHPKIEMSFYLLVFQNLISWLILSFLFILSALIFKQKRIRVIDFLGTVALARYPYLILVAFLFLIRIIHPELIDIDLTKGLQLHPSIMMSLSEFVVAGCIIWQIITYFFALKESSGLSSQKLWISFIVSSVLAEVIASSLLGLFL